jgi:ParB family chromosome partitioning protein
VSATEVANNLLPVHPAAEMFPLLTGAEFDALVADIKENGLREPIVLLDGKVLDGRNRMIACRQLGIEPLIREMGAAEVGDPITFTLSKNLHRRHLLPHQRGAILTDILKRKGWSPGKNKGGRPSRNGKLRGIPAVSIRAVAEDLGIPEKTARDHLHAAEAYAKATPKVRAKIDAGEVAAMQARTPGHHLARSTGEQEWFTPASHLDAARQVLDAIDLDPASCAAAQERVQATTFYSKQDNALVQPWKGRVWLNPPYSQPAIQRFVEKLVDELKTGNVTAAILLTNNGTDTDWWHTAAAAAQAVCFTRGRIKFESPASESTTPLQGQTFLYFGPEPERFREVFQQFGIVLPGGGA